MQDLCYTVFRTRWGYFGLAVVDDAVSRTCLPMANRKETQQRLLADLNHSGKAIPLNQGLLPGLQERIVAYFEGENIDFRVDPLIAPGRVTAFGQKVLDACRAIPFGRTMTYTDLARQVGCPGAARAVGGVMAANPIPLIVPCHRVLRTDGGLGGFSAPGGIVTKQRMLQHEQTLCVT